MGMGIRGGGVAREIQSLLGLGAIGSLNDGELLGRFLRRDDSAEPAFAALVERHGRMVLRICRDVLGDIHEAQDAAQSTFFILARQAASIRRPEALPSWLHGTARRVASRALRESIRRRKHERRNAGSAEAPTPEGPRPDWPELHEELARLPVRYRDPIVLCDLAGLTHEQAAGKLGCPARTLETRLHRGRQRLKDRLVRRGVAPSLAMASVAWASASQAGISPAWAASTTSAAARLAKGGGWPLAGDVPANAARWACDHLREIAMFKLKRVLGSGLLIGLAWQQVRSQTNPPKEPPRANSRAPQSPARPAPDPDRPAIDTHPIALTGRAFDPDGNLLAGAKVYLASRTADAKRVAKTSTDANGRYEFRDVPLPIERADTVDGRDHGTFQVFGEAKGFGFAFRPVKTFYSLPRPANFVEGPDRRDPPGFYEATDLIALDLNFPPAARLAGTIVDDRGKPLPGVRLEIRAGLSLIDVDDVRPGWSLEVLNEVDSAPASMKVRTTDALGRFEFEDMPVDCRFWIHTHADGYPSRSFFATTTRDPVPDHERSPVLHGDIKLTLATPLIIPVKVIFADTREPVPRVSMAASGNNVRTWQVSDDRGVAALKLPKGRYGMECWPDRGMPYLVTRSFLEVDDQPPTEPLPGKLRRAAELEVIVVEESTGNGLRGVDVWELMAGGFREKINVRSREVATGIIRGDSPRTNEGGKIRAFVEPGKHRYGVGLEAYPEGYEVIEAEGQEVECQTGETSTLKFRMRKRPG